MYIAAAVTDRYIRLRENVRAILSLHALLHYLEAVIRCSSSCTTPWPGYRAPNSERVLWCVNQTTRYEDHLVLHCTVFGFCISDPPTNEVRVGGGIT